MLTDLQHRTAQAIVNVFETSLVLGNYAQVTLIPGDTGQLTYGRSQTTLTSGGLHDVVARYCEAPDARFASDLSPFLSPLAACDSALNTNVYFTNLLRAAADDPVMRQVQDRFFDERYWQVAEGRAAQLGIETPLGVAVVYDSIVHGSFDLIRRRATNTVGRAADVGEQRWVREYVAQRLAWLSNHSRRDLRGAAYRPRTLQALIEHDDWLLDLPLVVRDVEISVRTLDALPPKVFDGPQPGSRDLTLTSPLARGLDVRLVQLALTRPENGLDAVADGIFGRGTSAAVKRFQGNAGLRESGIVDRTVFQALHL